MAAYQPFLSPFLRLCQLTSAVVAAAAVGLAQPVARLALYAVVVVVVVVEEVSGVFQ